MIPFLLAATFAVQPASATPPASPAPAIDWRVAEAPLLTNHVQLTFPDKFVKAGEAYFDHQQPPRWIVFQAVPVPEAGKQPDANYSMYVAELARNAQGAVTGIEEPVCISPPGSANTCGWIHPQHPDLVVFSSTLTPPKATDTPGYSRDRQRYSWQFPPEAEVVHVRPPALVVGDAHAPRPIDHTESAQKQPAPLFSRPGYDAEGSFSKDGRFYLYTHVDPTNNDPNLWVFDTKHTRHCPLVTAKGYDGGPFFSPDGKWICYRSDRRGDNNLQLFAGELAFGNDGDKDVPIGLLREVQLTDDKDVVNWCPFWHPSGRFLVYATSAVSHGNYEVFAIEFDPAKNPKDLRRARVTQAPGFDGLPAFSDDGTLMMWTSQRGPKRENEQRPSSQLWIATWTGEPTWQQPATLQPAATPTPAR